MPAVGFEPRISAGERPQTYALDRAATGTGPHALYILQIFGHLWMDIYSVVVTCQWCLKTSHRLSANVTWVKEITNVRSSFATAFTMSHLETVLIWQTSRVTSLVEAVRYKPEGRRFDSRWYHWNFSLS
jgi:hypothetical protein